MRQRLRRWWRGLWGHAGRRVEAYTLALSEERTVDLLVEIYGRSDTWTDAMMGEVIAQGFRTPCMVFHAIKGTPPLSFN